MENYLDNLNEQQRAAVLYTDGTALVIAGAGSGKTRVLTYKIVHLLHLGYSPSRIMALTFTNKAANEMKERISNLVGEADASMLWMGTFHSIFSRILRINSKYINFRDNFTIYDTADSLSLIKTIIKDMGLDSTNYNPRTIQSIISRAKNALYTPENYRNDRELRKMDDRASRSKTYAIYQAYWSRCRIAGAMDFDDLLLYTNILFRDNPEVLEKYQDYFQYVLVDEYQDTNFAQHMIVSQLCAKNTKLCVVGDDAQSIYSFRGANISNILGLKKSYPDLKTFKLERNYRSTQNIIEAANSLIEKNTQQIHKHIFSDNNVGSKVSVIQSYSDYEESYVVANQIISLRAQHGDSYNDFAILYRTNAQSRRLEEALRKRDIPYRIYGGKSFYQRKEIKDAIAYFRLTINPNDDEALRRIINTPLRGIGETTVKKLQEAALKANVSIWTVISSLGKLDIALNSATKSKLASFHNMINSFVKLNEEGSSASELAETIIRVTKLLSSIQSDNTPENISKVENLIELQNGIASFVDEKKESGVSGTSLNDFLSEISLSTSEEVDTVDGDGVSLMTVHAAKGLEFKNVIITGVEEDLFPSGMSSNSIMGIEEERRLLYVAITRAMNTCIMTYAKNRYKNGSENVCQVSRFIKDINPKYLSVNAISQENTASQHTGYFRENTRIFERQPFSFNERTSSQPQSQSVAKATGGEYGQHTVSEIGEGQTIEHSRFGLGDILRIDTSGADPKIIVNFKDVGEKTLLLKYAKFKLLTK